MKKLFLALILFGFVFAGVSLACVCYINPDGSSEWCEPAGCDETESYCVEEASYCIIGSRTLSCCEGLKCDVATKKCVVKPVTCGAENQACCTNDACSNSELYCSKSYYNQKGQLIIVSPHCCYKNAYYDGTRCIDHAGCYGSGSTDCPYPASDPWSLFVSHPKCIYLSGSNFLTCCSVDNYGSPSTDYVAVKVY